MVRSETQRVAYYAGYQDYRTGLHSPACLTIHLTSRIRSVSLEFDNFNLPVELLGLKFSKMRFPNSFPLNKSTHVVFYINYGSGILSSWGLFPKRGEMEISARGSDYKKR